MSEIVIHDCEQGSETWHGLRRRVTGTGFAKVMAKGQGKTRAQYMRELVAERIYETTVRPDYCSYDMKRGIELEPEGCEFYEEQNDCVVKKIGFIELNSWVGVSPDGLVGKDGGVEIKCPTLLTQIDRIAKGVFPSTYHWQVHGTMWVAGLQWIDFVSYCPEAVGGGRDDRLFQIRVERDEKIIDELKYETNRFINEMKTKIISITGMAF